MSQEIIQFALPPNVLLLHCALNSRACSRRNINVESPLEYQHYSAENKV